jgi:Fe-S cluster biogenesis protein NfuA
MKLFNKKKSSLEKEIIILLESKINPSVAMHGGNISFKEWDEDNGILYLFLQGACSGCAMSSATLKMGVENMIKHYFPEVKLVEGIDDPNSNVDPYY